MELPVLIEELLFLDDNSLKNKFKEMPVIVLDSLIDYLMVANTCAPSLEITLKGIEEIAKWEFKKKLKNLPECICKCQNFTKREKNYNCCIYEIYLYEKYKKCSYERQD